MPYTFCMGFSMYPPLLSPNQSEKLKARGYKLSQLEASSDMRFQAGRAVSAPDTLGRLGVTLGWLGVTLGSLGMICGHLG